MKNRRGLVFALAGLATALCAGWVLFPYGLYRRMEQPLPFSHRVHTGEKGGMACEDCHPLREDGRFAGIPPVAKCAECHAEPLGSTPEEKVLVEEYVRPGKEIPWLVYSRQPDNVYFSHAPHLRRGAIPCARCHGPEGTSERPQVYQVNRLSGYSRDIWGHSLSRLGLAPWEGKKMTDCARCHRRTGRQDSCLDCHK
jgi:menaquinone reductase, multiheme cytochrome c subunit